MLTPQVSHSSFLRNFLSAGFSILPEEAEHKQKELATSKESESSDRPPMVSEEDISVSYSTFQDCISKPDRDSPAKPDGDSPATELFHREPVQQDFSGKTPDPLEEMSLKHQQEYL